MQCKHSHFFSPCLNIMMLKSDISHLHVALVNLALAFYLLLAPSFQIAAGICATCHVLWGFRMFFSIGLCCQIDEDVFLIHKCFVFFFSSNNCICDGLLHKMSNSPCLLKEMNIINIIIHVWPTMSWLINVLDTFNHKTE